MGGRFGVGEALAARERLQRREGGHERLLEERNRVARRLVVVADQSRGARLLAIVGIEGTEQHLHERTERVAGRELWQLAKLLVEHQLRGSEFVVHFSCWLSVVKIYLEWCRNDQVAFVRERFEHVLVCHLWRWRHKDASQEVKQRARLALWAKHLAALDIFPGIQSHMGITHSRNASTAPEDGTAAIQSLRAVQAKAALESHGAVQAKE